MRITVLDDWTQIASSLAPWHSLDGVDQVTFLSDRLARYSDVVAALHDADAVCVMRERTALGAEVFASLPRLRLVVTAGRRNAAIDLDAATAHGITVCGTSSTSEGTAELTWGLLLAAARDLVRQDRSVRAGQWQTHVGHTLAGRQLGLVGLGRIGARVASYGQAFGMRVVAWSPNLSDERTREVGVERVSREALLRESDVVSVHMRLGERSRGLIGGAELAMMRPTAILVNTSRSAIVDEEALVHALREGRLAAAALDVFDQEPLPADHPLTHLPTMLLSPHLGYATVEGLGHFYREMVEVIRAWQSGTPIGVISSPPM